VHSDCWLLSVVFYNGARLPREGRERLFQVGLPCNNFHVARCHCWVFAHSMRDRLMLLVLFDAPGDAGAVSKQP
jgi:hypothetical protein